MCHTVFRKIRGEVPRSVKINFLIFQNSNTPVHIKVYKYIYFRKCIVYVKSLLRRISFFRQSRKQSVTSKRSYWHIVTGNNFLKNDVFHNVGRRFPNWGWLPKSGSQSVACPGIFYWRASKSDSTSSKMRAIY